MIETPTRHEVNWLKLATVGGQLFSTCGKAQYFAIVLDVGGRVIGTGYNGSPPGMGHCNEGYCPRLAENSPPGSDYSNCISVHAEENALLYSDFSLRRGGTLIISGSPCWSCSKKIAGSGIKRVVFLLDRERESMYDAFSFLESAGVTLVPVQPGTI